MVDSSPDLSVEIIQPLHLYLTTKNLVGNELINYNYILFTRVPSQILSVEYKNTSFQNFNFVIGNDQFLDSLNFSLNYNQVILTSISEEYASINNFNITLNPYLLNVSFDIKGFINQSHITDYFLGKDELTDILPFDNSIIVSEISFLNVINQITLEDISNITDEEFSTSLYNFVFQKEHFIYLTPLKAYKKCLEFSQPIISHFLSIYAPYFSSPDILKIVFHDLLLSKILQLTKSMNLILIISSVIFVLIAFIFIYSHYYLLVQQQSKFKETSFLLQSRGFKLRYLVKLNLGIKITVNFSAFIVSLLTIFIFFLIQEIYRWSYSYFIIVISDTLVLLPVIFFQIKTHLMEKNLLLQKQLYAKPKKSRSEFISRLFQIILIIMSCSLLISIWLSYQKLLGKDILLNQSIIFIVLAIVILAVSTSFLFINLVKIISFFFKKMLLYLKLPYHYIMKYLKYIYTDKKNLFSIIFILLFLNSFLIIGFDLAKKNYEINNISSRCYDVSLLFPSMYSNEVISVLNTNDFLISYIDMEYSKYMQPKFFIYLTNPLKYYEGVHFFRKSFREHQNQEIFQILNSSENFVITSKREVEEEYLEIGDKVYLSKTSINSTIFIEEKTLLDYTKFLPFFSKSFGIYSWYLLKYNEENDVPTNFRSSIISFDNENNISLVNIIDLFEEYEIKYTIIHQVNASDIESSFEENEIYNYFKFILFLEIFVTFFLVYIIYSIRTDAIQNAKTIIQRGIKKQRLLVVFDFWVSLILTITLLISLTINLLLFKLVIFIYNSFNIFQAKISISYISLFVPLGIFLMIIMLIFIPSYVYNKRTNSLKNQKKVAKNE